MPDISNFPKKHLILNIINHLGPISRTKLIALTDYRPASVSAIIKELLDDKLIIETGYYSAGYGRNRIMLEINKAHLCAIGISFVAERVTYIVAQIDGTILCQDSAVIAPDLPKEGLIQTITAHVDELLRQYHDKNMIGIGISDPLYDPTTYRLSNSLVNNYTHFNDWVHLRLKPKLETLSGLLVETYSGVAMPVMAEQRFGVAKGAQNFVCIELSNGIGASLCCNGLPVTGANGVAGELGHTVIDYQNAGANLCYCGKPGCVENGTAYPALAAAIKAALDRGVLSVLNADPDHSQGITVQAIRRALDEGDRLCMYYVKDIAIRLGVAISNVVNLLNPELVVLYGFMLELGDFFLQHLENALRENVVALAGNFKIRTSAALETTFPLGAVAEIFSSYFKQDDYKKWIYQLQPGNLAEQPVIQDNLNKPEMQA